MASLDCDTYSHISAEAPAAAQPTRYTTRPSTKIDSFTPVSVEESSTSTSASLLSQSQQSLHAGEMDDRAAEISIETFLDEFTCHIEIPDLDRATWLITTPLDSLDIGEKEVDTYAPLVSSCSLCSFLPADKTYPVEFSTLAAWCLS